MNAALSRDRIMEVFCSLAGSENAEKGRVLCEAGARDVEKRLRSDCDAAEHMNTLCYTAGCLAYYRFILASGCGENESFRAGDITVNSKADPHMVGYARTLLCDALENSSELLRGRRGVFKSF